MAAHWGGGAIDWGARAFGLSEGALRERIVQDLEDPDKGLLPEKSYRELRRKGAESKYNLGKDINSDEADALGPTVITGKPWVGYERGVRYCCR